MSEVAKPETLLRLQFPEYADWRVRIIASEIDVIDIMPTELADRVRDLENEGYFREDAYTAAIERATTTVRAPAGHLFLRIEKENEKPLLLLVKGGEVQ